MQLSTEQRRDLAREPDHREQVDAIHGRCHVENLSRIGSTSTSGVPGSTSSDSSMIPA